MSVIVPTLISSFMMLHKQIGYKPYFRFLLIKHSIISTFVISHIFAMALIFLGIKPKYTTIYPTDLLMQHKPSYVFPLMSISKKVATIKVFNICFIDFLEISRQYNFIKLTSWIYKYENQQFVLFLLILFISKNTFFVRQSLPFIQIINIFSICYYFLSIKNHICKYPQK